jgi:hypothetical protein
MNQVNEFWDWFSDHATILAMSNVSSQLLSELDQRVSALGAFVWELGPAFDLDGSQFVISPACDVKHWQASRQIVAAAPSLKGWEFYAEKQPKKWDFQFEANDGQTTRRFDLRNWQYALLRFPDLSIDIFLFSQELAACCLESREPIAVTALVSLLGESMFMLRIVGVVVTPTKEDKALPRSQLIDLSEHLRNLDPI